jgi:hypothetical protein
MHDINKTAGMYGAIRAAAIIIISDKRGRGYKICP